MTFFGRIMSNTLRMALLIIILVSLSFIYKWVSDGSSSAISVQFAVQIGQTVLASLFVAIPAIILLSLSDKRKDKHSG